MANFPYLDFTGPIALAHRGGAGEWPENTMEAFAGAYRAGIRYMETDVHLSADGQVVAFHDPVLDRVTDGRHGAIGRLQWRDISQVRVNGVGRIPLLAELLQVFPDAKFNIDMKSDASVMPTVDIIRSAGAIDRVCLTSFHDRRIIQARAQLGDALCTSAGRLAVARQVLRSRGWPLAAPDVPLFQVPIKRYGLQVFTPAFMELCQRERTPVHVWTIDDAQQMHALLDLGVDGIVTDHPMLLRDVLHERGQWL